MYTNHNDSMNFVPPWNVQTDAADCAESCLASCPLDVPASGIGTGGLNGLGECKGDDGGDEDNCVARIGRGGGDGDDADV